jgi:hypothetical protein
LPRLHPAVQSSPLHRIRQGHSIHHRGQHAHVISGNAIHTRSRRSNAAKDIATANYDRHLHTHGQHLSHLGHDTFNHSTVDTVTVIAHQRFAGEF